MSGNIILVNLYLLYHLLRLDEVEKSSKFARKKLKREIYVINLQLSSSVVLSLKSDAVVSHCLYFSL